MSCFSIGVVVDSNGGRSSRVGCQICSGTIITAGVDRGLLGLSLLFIFGGF